MKKSELKQLIREEIKKYLIAERINIDREIKAWAKNIADNYNKDRDTDILSQLYTACHELGLDLHAVDKKWQYFHPGYKVRPEDIAKLLKAGLKEQFQITDKGLERTGGNQIQIIPGGSYHLGASDTPNHIIVTKVSPDRFWYRSYPYERDQAIEMWIGKDLIESGLKNWLKSAYSAHYPERAAAYKRTLAGGKPLIEKLEDYQYWDVELKGDEGVDVYKVAKAYGIAKDWDPKENTVTAKVMKKYISDLEKEKGIKILSKKKK